MNLVFMSTPIPKFKYFEIEREC